LSSYLEARQWAVNSGSELHSAAEGERERLEL
jgi:hypothetical protein